MGYRFIAAFAWFAVLLLAGSPASAQRIKIGIATTLSGPMAEHGRDFLDGFLLIVSKEGGRLGGAPVEIIAENDSGDPESAGAIAERFIRSERVSIVTGGLTAPVVASAAAPVLKADRFYIAPAASPMRYTGEKCRGNYFSLGWQVAAPFELAGLQASRSGYDTATVITTEAALQASVTGFKRFFAGETTTQIIVADEQTDFSAELSRLNKAAPQALLVALPKAMAASFLNQLLGVAASDDELPEALFVPELIFSADDLPDRIWPRLRAVTSWTPDIAKPAYLEFGKQFEAKFGRPATRYAAFGREAALHIASALRATGGKVRSDPDNFRIALRKAEFPSLGGAIRFANNNHLIRPWFSLTAEPRDGKPPERRIGDLISTGYRDNQATYCPLI